MFKKLFIFSYQRTKKEAFGFFVTHGIILMGLVFLAGSLIVSPLGWSGRLYIGSLIITIISVVYILGISFLILKKKNRLNLAFILGIIFNSMFTYFISGIGGLIFVSYLTTTKKLGFSNNNENTA